jgi:nicotinamide phosphoribosyltransferase
MSKYQSLSSIMTNTDSYKVSMARQYPAGTTNVFSYIESRGGRWDQTLFFGLQGFLKEYLIPKITKEQIDFAEKFWTIHGEPFDRTPWDIVLNEYGGNIPVTVKAVKEGTLVPTKNALVTIELTKDDDRLRGLVTWVETALLRAVWYPTTVATQSWEIKQLIKSYLIKSGDVSGLPFKLHDFGARGVSSLESARIGGAAHLTNFMGTDTAESILWLADNYNAPLEEIAFSIPAAEHSTITSWTKGREFSAYHNMVELFAKPGAIFAVVSDSYDIYEATKKWVKMRHEIMASGATLVIRPDSGDPCVVLPRILAILRDGFTEGRGLGGQYFPGFPCAKNDKGYNVLQHVRVIWGDGINQLSIHSILRMVVDMHGWSADMVAFGMGGALLQQLDRDTLKWAMKCSAAKVAGTWVDVFKDPVTDPGKKSKTGRLALMKNSDGSFYTGVEDWPVNHLEPVYVDGQLVREQSLKEIRAISEN